MDTSALLKFLKDDEAEAEALRAYVLEHAEPQFVSSALIAVEARRGMQRVRPDGLPKVDLLLAAVTQIDISGPVIESASRLPGPQLRSLDAIHLATALLIRDDIEVLVSYDQRLLDAAAEHDLPTAAPV